MYVCLSTYCRKKDKQKPGIGASVQIFLFFLKRILQDIFALNSFIP